LLLAPKLLALALILQRGAGEYGGAARVTASVVLESLLSALLAPTRMLFHARFVLAALGGWRIQWRSPPRDDAATTWRDAWRHQRGHLLIGALVLAPPVVHGLAAGIWVLPVGLALLLGIAASVWTSSVAAGRIARAAQLFVVPEESRVPDELRLLRRYLRLQPVAAGILALRHDAELRGLLVAASRRRGSTVPRVLLAGDPRLWSAAQRTALLDSPALMAQWLAAADTTRGLPSRVASAAAPPLIAASSAAPLGAGVAMAAG
jgi:membrane glycosyltransferase